MGVTPEEATNLYYAEQTYDEFTDVVANLLTALKASPLPDHAELAAGLSAAEEKYVEAFHDLTDLVHEAEVTLEHWENRCVHCGR